MTNDSDDFARRLRWFRRLVEARTQGQRGGTWTAVETARGARLRTLFGLDEHQAGFVWACVCAAADPLLHAALVALGGADGRRGLSLATYGALLGDEAAVDGLATWLASEPAIRRHRLIVAAVDGLLPGATPHRPAARLVSYLAGSDELDPVLARIGGVVAVPERLQLDPAHRSAAARITAVLEQPGPPLLYLVGPRGAGRRTLAAAAAAMAGRAVVFLDGHRVPPAQLDEAIAALHREALLRGAVPLIANADAMLHGERAAELARILAGLLDDGPGACVVTTADAGFELPVTRAVTRLELRFPEALARAAMWRDALGAGVDDGLVRELASRYRLGAGAIRAAAATTQRTSPTVVPVRRTIVAAVRDGVAERFGGLAERLDVADHLDAAVLPAETADQVQALIGRVRNAYRVFEEWRFPRQTARGGGVAALFTGPPGTGKTLVAGLVARELERDLYRVDLSRVVSKWVGETEKQLGAVFDAAEASDALLLFDEADALFARRTEVRSSSDRYANLEVNYLLQRIETFSGVTILTTNLDTSIDPALRRRLAAHVVFWPPEHDDRVRLWRQFVSTGAPVIGELDLDALAADYPDMTGANIRNASLAAACLAASADGAIAQDLMVRAARSEYRAMGRVLGRK